MLLVMCQHKGLIGLTGYQVEKNKEEGQKF